MKKYISCLLLLLALVLPMLGMEAQAATTGTCGENVTWSLDDAGILTISGTGDMYDYDYASAPWYEQRAKIKSVVIEDGVSGIGECAFYGCVKMTSITIADSVTQVEYYAFENCNGLMNVYITDIAAWLNLNNRSWLLTGNELEKKLYLGGELLTDLVIPDSVTEIGEYAFCNCSSLASVTIPESVTTIGNHAFSGCSNLESVTIPDSVTTMGNSVFSRCSNLKSVTIPDSVTTMGNSVFSGCSSLESVTIPDSVTNIGLSAFSGCSSLESVTIPDSVTEIGSSAFAYCSSLASVTIPDSVTEVGYEAFYKCSSLESVTIGDSVTTIGDYAFRGCSSLKSVTIPDSVTEIGESAFSYCSSLESVTIPESLTSIGDFAFYFCSSLKSVTIGDSVTEIGGWAFAGCSSLKIVIISDSVTYIGYDAFYGCSSLESVTIGDSVTEIGAAAFAYCSSLESVTIPDSVTEIGGSAFYDCSSLVSVTIPDSVTEIGESAFSGCSSLTDIYYGGTEEQWDALDGWSEADWIHYGCTTAEGHWTSKGMTMVCSCGYTQGSIDNPENQLHLAGYVGQTFTVEVTSGSNYDYELTGENSDYVSVSLSGISTTVTGSGTVYGKEYTLTFSQPGHYELAFEQDWTGNTFCFSADIYAKDNSFEDVAEDAYYFGPVLWAVNEGITNGMSENSFAPEATCTRGQIVTFLWRANGSPEPTSSTNPFWDVTEGDYFYKAVLWAVENGITSGMGDGTFAPDAPCTRGQVATFLWRSEGQPSSDGENIFTDIAPGTYYYDAVLWAVANGITNGVGEGLFAPDATCTRGQIVTFLYRAMA